MTIRTYLAAATAALCTLLAGCERPPIDTTQNGYRGTGMAQVVNPRIAEAAAGRHAAPAPAPAVPSDGPKASETYQNVQLLGDLSVAEFNRHMIAITSWVAPKEGCTYCHNAENLADDGKYTKVVARRMIEMTRSINTDWKAHVADTGVTCYTCHRGNPVPGEIWFTAPDAGRSVGMLGNKDGQNTPAASVALASLPYDPFTPFLSGAREIRVNGPAALPTTQTQGLKEAEWTYGLMMHMSDGLGVNCTYCHNAQAFQPWESSTPQRVTAWHGIRMARQLNVDYMTPLTDKFPANRLGPGGDVAKVNCATCHQGANKPLKGAKMAKDHPELGGG